MTLALENITPKIAEELAQFSVGQPSKPRVIAALAESMRAGKWVAHASTITIRPDGRVFDGVQRLWAVVMSGLPQLMLVDRQ